MASNIDWAQVEDNLNKKSDEASQARREVPPKELSNVLSELNISVRETTPKTTLTAAEERFLAFRHSELNKAIEAFAGIAKELAKLRGVVRAISTNQSMTEDGRSLAVNSINKRREELLSRMEEAAQSSPEGALLFYTREIRKFVRQLRRGRIVETEFVRQKLEEIVNSLTKGQVVLIHGETGTGKTEVAKIAAKRFNDREPIVVRGYAGMDSSELFGHMTLKRSDDMAEVQRTVEKRVKALEELHQNVSGEDRKRVILDTLCEQGVTVSEYVLGAVYEAAKEGRTIIIDEVNYIPPDLLAKLNDIFTKRPGELITVQEDGMPPIVVKEGFSIILTGNINYDGNNRYEKRHKLDPAFLDRITSVEYNYLPQAVEGGYKDFSARDKQLFQIAVASLLAPYRVRPELEGKEWDMVRSLESIENRHGALYLPGGTAGLDAVWRLSKFASVTQQAFAGMIKDGDPYAYQREGQSIGYQPEVSISPRVLMKILQDWREDGYKHPLEQYIERHLLARAKLAGREDREYLYQLAKKFGFFNEGEEQNLSIEFVPGREVIEALFEPIPVRKTWPDEEISNVVADQEKTAKLLLDKAQAETLQKESGKILDEYAALLEEDEAS